MTLAQLRTAVLEELNERDNARFKRSMLDRWLNDGLRIAVAASEYLQKSQAITVTGTKISLPTDFYKATGVSLVQGGVKYPVDPGLDSSLDTDLGTGTPYNYHIWGQEMYFTPTPSTALTGTLRYVAYPASMVADNDIPELPDAYHLMLVVYAAERALLVDGKADKAGAYMQDYRAQLTQLKNDVLERKGLAVIREVS